MQSRERDYALLKQLGAGSFGTVWQALHKSDHKLVAIKQVDLDAANDDISEIQQEISLLAACDCEYITKYYESFVIGYKLWIVMEFLSGGSLADFIHDEGVLNEVQLATVSRDLLHGLAYLHNQGKIHRDIKAANVLLSENGTIKLADFGVAAQLASNLSQRHTFVGTPFWMAPEVIRQAAYDQKADIWSLGITALESLWGHPPLAEHHPMRVIFLIPRNPAPILTGAYSNMCKSFITACLQKDVRKRATAVDLGKHEFILFAAQNRFQKSELVSQQLPAQLLTDDASSTLKTAPTMKPGEMRQTEEPIACDSLASLTWFSKLSGTSERQGIPLDAQALIASLLKSMRSAYDAHPELVDNVVKQFLAEQSIMRISRRGDSAITKILINRWKCRHC